MTDLIYDLKEIMKFPNNSGLTRLERYYNLLPNTLKNKGMKGDQMTSKRVGRRVAYPGSPLQRRAIRKNLSEFLDYLKFPRELRNEKDKIYKIMRSMFIHSYIMRKNNILFKIERDRILEVLEDKDIIIEMYKIALSFQYNLINDITSALYTDRKDIYDNSLQNKYKCAQIKDILNNDTTLRYIKKIEQLLSN